MVTDELLAEFKNRMRISHSAENDNLRVILAGSLSAINDMVGSNDINDLSVKELVLERSRYVYNDSLEYFADNFKDEIARVSLRLTLGGASDKS